MIESLCVDRKMVKTIAKSIAPRIPTIGDIVCVKYLVNKKKEKWYAGYILTKKNKKSYQYSCKIKFDTEDTTETLKMSEYNNRWFITNDSKETIVEEKTDDEETEEIEEIEEIEETTYEESKHDDNERFQKLEQMIEDLKNKQRQSDDIKIHGSYSKYASDLFANLTPKMKMKYVSGLGDPNNSKAKAMCAYYKNLENVCRSKVLSERKFFKTKNDKKNKVNAEKRDVYISDDGRYVHKALFFEKIVREKADNYQNIVSHYKLCPACLSTYCNRDHFILVFNSTKKICLICRRKTRSSDTDLICRACMKTDANGYEHALRQMCNQFKIFMPRYNIFINDNVSVKVNNIKYVIDIRMNGLYEGICASIVIEKDEKKHAGKGVINEKKKLIYETFAIMDANENVRQKVLVIRYNSDSDYTENGIMHSDYNGVERLLILRRWIIWWLLNLQNVRDMLILFMWYNDDTITGFENFKGFAKVYHAPEPVNMAWEYCTDPYEYEYLKSVNSPIINNEQPIEFQWEKLYEDDKNKYPSELKALLTN